MAKFKAAKNQVVLKDGKKVAEAEDGIIETRNQGTIDYLRFCGFQEVGRTNRDDIKRELKEQEKMDGKSRGK